MKSWILPGCASILLLLGSPAHAQYAPAQNVIGGGLAGAGVGAALGAIAGGGSGAATGALIGGTVGAVGGALSTPPPAYGYAPRYRHYTTYRRCGAGWHWVPRHHTSWGEWRPGHCSPNY